MLKGLEESGVGFSKLFGPDAWTLTYSSTNSFGLLVDFSSVAGAIGAAIV